jgi:hypothetical protein
MERRSNEAPADGSLRRVRKGAERRASDHYRFDAEQKRRARLSWLPSLLKTGSHRQHFRILRAKEQSTSGPNGRTLLVQTITASASVGARAVTG